MVKELKYPSELPIQWRMYNQAAIATITNEASSSKTKHVDIKHNYIKELYRLKLVLPSYVTTTNMKAVLLTKIMPAPTFVRLRTMIGINDPGNHEGKIRGGVLVNTDVFGSEKDGSYLYGYPIIPLLPLSGNYLIGWNNKVDKVHIKDIW